MSGYIGNIPTPQATQSRQSFTATASQTTFATVGYTAGFIDVYLNGVHLLNGTDYTATNGSDIVLTTGAALNDVVEFVAYGTYEVNSQNYTGGLTVDNDGATVLTVDRATSDGTIIDVQKNGVSVGRIATYTGKTSIGSSDVNLWFYDPAGFEAVLPRKANNGVSDGFANLGNSSNRFKDLYLSGGAYLGGTVAANKLDDYEEGTWTPTSTQLDPLTVLKAQYTKVGRQVHLFAQFTTSVTSPVAIDTSVSISNLPFTIDTSTVTGLGGILQFYSSFGQDRNASAVIINNANDLQCEIIVVRGTFNFNQCLSITVNLTYNTTA